MRALRPNTPLNIPSNEEIEHQAASSLNSLNLSVGAAMAQASQAMADASRAVAEASNAVAKANNLAAQASMPPGLDVTPLE